MKTFILDGAAVMGREDLHEKLARGLGLPDWYGGNLDALYDCLTDLEETVICIANRSSLEEALGNYVNLFLRVLKDAAEENPRLHLEM